MVNPPSALCTAHQLTPVTESASIDASATKICKPITPRAVLVRVGFVDGVS
jgi:hypothetical protein